VRTFRKHVAGIRHHHEMWDGTGYPDKLRGLEIPLEARIVSLADAFDAMTSTRPYRVGLPIAFAMEEMRRMRGRQFCPNAVDAFVRVLQTSGVGDPATQESAAAGTGQPESTALPGVHPDAAPQGSAQSQASRRGAGNVPNAAKADASDEPEQVTTGRAPAA
jgi:hypothetical protein